MVDILINEKRRSVKSELQKITCIKIFLLKFSAEVNLLVAKGSLANLFT